jgi:serine-type D-Ala-D-Ala carboxypeptidase/endopeptidase (penicillin-binding protein 4)
MTPGGPAPTGRSRRAATERTTGEWTAPTTRDPFDRPRRPVDDHDDQRYGDLRYGDQGYEEHDDGDRGYGRGHDDDRGDRGDRGGRRRDDERGGAPAGRFRWLLPAALAVVAVLAALGAVVLNQDDPAAAVGVTAPTTPVLSARRVPELIAAPVADRRLSADLQGWVAQSSPSSCLVVSAGNRPLFQHNPTTPLVGASTQKLVTATALLLAFGPDAKLSTVAGAAAPPAAGVVAGDLYMVGGGDPLLSTPGYVGSLPHGQIIANDPAKLADAIVAAGVTRIEGSVVGDDSRYDDDRFNDQWPGRFASQSVVGSVSALSVDDSRNTLGLDPPPADPATNAAAMLSRLLTDRGVQIGGPARSGPAPANLTKVAELPSQTVRERVAEMLTESDNDTAEMSFKEIGLQKGGAGTWAAGATAVTGLLTDAGIPLDGVRIVDGSGLSDADRLTCGFIVGLLTRPETGPTLVEGLAVAGQTGTLTDRWDGTPVEGRLRAKTGTLNTVTALSGRVEALQGGTLTFSYVTNSADGIDGEDVAKQEGLADILVGYPRGVDLSVLLPAPPPAGTPSDPVADPAAAATTTVPPAAPPAQ